jgi:hypothetical protein
VDEPIEDSWEVVADIYNLTLQYSSLRLRANLGL